MNRMVLFAKDGSPLPEVWGDELLSCSRTEEINGEHALSFSSPRHLEEGTRALTLGADGRWREWVIDEVGESHDSGPHAVGNYHLVWSLQYDLQAVCGPDVDYEDNSSVSASTAMREALSGSQIWSVGTVEPSGTNVCVMQDDSAWDRLSYVVSNWGGEIDVTIEVGPSGVTSRKVNLLNRMGSSKVSRRFEYGFNMTSISRNPGAGPYYCRVIPKGGEAKDADGEGLGYRVTVSSVNGGKEYVADPQAEQAFRYNVGGTWIYPTKAIVYNDLTDPSELLRVARDELYQTTRPEVTYEATVYAFRQAGMDDRGVQLGDDVQVVDHGFNKEAPLKIQSRVLRIEVDELKDEVARLTIGRLRQTIARVTAKVQEQLEEFDFSKYDEQFEELNDKVDDTEKKIDGLTEFIDSIDWDNPVNPIPYVPPEDDDGDDGGSGSSGDAASDSFGDAASGSLDSAANDYPLFNDISSNIEGLGYRLDSIENTGLHWRHLINGQEVGNVTVDFLLDSDLIYSPTPGD